MCLPGLWRLQQITFLAYAENRVAQKKRIKKKKLKLLLFNEKWTCENKWIAIE